MTVSRAYSAWAVLLALPLAVGACSAAPTASPTAVPTAQSTVVPAAQPIATTKPTIAASPAASTSPTSSVTLAIGPTAAATAATGPSATDLAAKAKANAEYSFDFKVTTAGQTITGKTFVKGTKMRQEMNVGGINNVILTDTSTKVAYSLLAEQKMATKLDFSKVAAQAEQPGARAASLDNDAKLVGRETIDGKSAAVYDVASSSSKLWLWTENGMPLKMETTSAEGKTVIEYTNYKFGSQPDSLFDLPSGTQIVELPTGLPGGLGMPGQAPSR